MTGFMNTRRNRKLCAGYGLQPKMIVIVITRNQASYYRPHTPRADPCLLFGRDVNSYRILAKVSACLLSEKSISANAFSYARRGTLFCGSETRLSKIVAAFRQISGTGCGALTTFNSRSIALKYIYTCLVTN